MMTADYGALDSVGGICTVTWMRSVDHESGIVPGPRIGGCEDKREVSPKAMGAG
jgi:hypothetical protein